MAETVNAHSLSFSNNLLTITGVEQVVEVSVKEAQLKLAEGSLQIKGTGLNVVKLDRAEGTVQLEVESLQSITYKQGSMGLKGLFR